MRKKKVKEIMLLVGTRRNLSSEVSSLPLPPRPSLLLLPPPSFCIWVYVYMFIYTLI